MSDGNGTRVEGAIPPAGDDVASQERRFQHGDGERCHDRQELERSPPPSSYPLRDEGEGCKCRHVCLLFRRGGDEAVRREESEERGDGMTQMGRRGELTKTKKIADVDPTGYARTMEALTANNRVWGVPK
eukprot:752085-Hanusia_phi.AAC.1